MAEDQELEKVSIFSVQIHFTPTTDEFWGACIDSGAQRTVVGQKHADAYLSQTTDDKAISQFSETNPKLFRFGDNSHKCNGVLHVRMPVADDIVVKFDDFIVPIDIPVLLGLNVL